MEQRIIGRYEGQKDGPLLICIGGMHGNEPAGVLAIQEIFNLLQNEPIVNPDFQYRGSLVGMRGSLAALSEKKRFIDRDLNRMLTGDEIKRIYNTELLLRSSEDNEAFELISAIEEEIKNHHNGFTLILDFHTTTADGGIFTIAANDPMSRELALGLHAPVILGIAEGLEGTTIEYFNHPENNCYCIVFEAGQHDDPGCVHRSVAAIVNCMRSIGSVDSRDVDHRHDGLLISLAIGLPKMTKLIYHYKINPGEKFIMNPGYRNFEQVHAGQEIAANEFGAIRSPYDGMILMPKYQPQGDDGFFIVESIEI